MKHRAPSVPVDLNCVAERFAKLSAAVFDGVLIYDSGVVLNATRGAAELLGRSATDLQRCRVNELVTREWQPVLEQHLASMEHKSCPAMVRRADGTTIAIEWNVQASLTYHGRQVHVVTLRDVSRDEAVGYLTDRGIARKRSATRN